MGRNRKDKSRISSGGRSHVVKTNQERSEYDDLVRTAPTTDPTDEIRATFSERSDVESVDSQHPVHVGVAEKRTRITTTVRKIPWGAISGIIAAITVTAIVVAAYDALKGKIYQIDSLVIESKINTEKMRDHLGNIRERLAQLETKLGLARLDTDRFEQYLKEIESLKVAVGDIQAKNKELKEVALPQIEKRIEQLEKELSREKKGTDN